MKVAKEIRPIDVLCTARWLTMAEACEYSRKSINTLKKLIASGKIYADKRGEWTVDRQSIDDYFNARRDDMNIFLAKKRRVLCN
jgi:hypothetical protein